MKVLILFFILLFSFESFGAHRDFKGLFGSYRRERYTENEGHAHELGFDLMFSTLFPVTPFVKSSSDGASYSNMNYANFFNLEGSIFYTLTYSWELFLNVGYYTYDTQKETPPVNPTPVGNAQFHLFEMKILPVMLGARYRFSTEDIVPYVGVAAGMAQVKRRASYDYSNQFDEESSWVLAAEALVGLEFFFAPRAGVRLEAAAHYLNLDSKTFNAGSAPSTLPLIQYQSSPISVRYASGLFFLF